MDGYTAAEIHAVLGVQPVTLRVWVHRGHVEKLGRDSYDLDSVVRRLQEITQPADDGLSSSLMG